MRKRERAAALSAVGLMFIAGCSGGRSVGTTPPSIPNGGGGSQGAVSAPHNATLQIMIPPLQSSPASAHRSTSAVRYVSSARRYPTWVSPYSANATLSVVPTNGGPTYTTSFALSSCTTGSTSYGEYYNCGVNVPYGSNTFYVGLYDSANNLLSTNLFANPTPQTVNPNGSGSANTIAIYEQGVLASLQTTSPVMCFSAGHPQPIDMLFMDADGAPIIGPLANPITANFTAYNGAGLGAIGLYAVYLTGAYSTYAINNGFTLYDTSMYSPYLWVSGQEGAIQVAATVANIPVYNNGAYTYTPVQAGYAATGTYTAWGIGAGGYDLYPIAIESGLHQAVPCGDVGGAYQQWTYISALVDPTSHSPYLVLSDFSNVVHLYDAYVTAQAIGHSYAFFQGANSYGDSPGLKFRLAQSSQITASGPLVNVITSNLVPGRLLALESSPSPGTIDIIDTANGIPNGGPGPYTTQIALASATRLAGEGGLSPYALYYDQGAPFSTWLYGVFTGGAYPGTPTVTYNTGSTVYSIAPSGSTYVFFRSASQLCDFDSASFGSGVFCGAISGPGDGNPVSLTYNSGSGELLWATGGGTTAYAENALQSPASFQAGMVTATAITLPHGANRFINTTAAPSIVGFYGGPLTCTVAPYTANSGEITWVQYSGGSWTVLASACWPNPDVTITYP